LNKFKSLVCCKHCCSFSNKLMDVSSNKIDILSKEEYITI